MKLMKNIAAYSILAAALFGPRWGFADTTTTRFGLTKPAVGSVTWGPKINTNYDIIDNAGGLTLTNTWTNVNVWTAVSSFTAQVQLATGSFTLPSLAGIGSNSGTGIFFPATNQLGISVNGSTAAYYSTGGLTIQPGFTLTVTTETVTNLTATLAANLNMNGFKGVSVASATAGGDIPRFAQVWLVQGVSTTTTTNSTNNTTTFANTKLCGSIVTRLANSEIWLIAEQPTFTNNPANAEVRFARNGTAIGNTHMGSYANATSLLFGNSGIYLGADAPGAAAGTTESYCTQIRSSSGGTNVGTGDGSTAYNQQMWMIEVNKSQ